MTEWHVGLVPVTRSAVLGPSSWLLLVFYNIIYMWKDQHLSFNLIILGGLVSFHTSVSCHFIMQGSTFGTMICYNLPKIWAWEPGFNRHGSTNMSFYDNPRVSQKGFDSYWYVYRSIHNVYRHTCIITLHDIAFHFITLHCMTSHYITLHCI